MIKWTPRNTVNLIGAIIACAGLLYAMFGGPLPATFDAAHMQALAIGLLVGLLTPGSPIGRILDSLFPPPDAKPEPIDAQTIRDAGAALAPPQPQRVQPSRESGSTSADPVVLVMLLATAWALVNATWHRWGPVLLMALGLAGCGASALSQHAAGTTVAIVAVRGAEDVYLAHLTAAEDTCHDEACVHQARAEHAPAEAALDAFRAAVLAWRDAVEVALHAEQTDDVIGALATAAARVFARWHDLVEAMRPLGVNLPTFPAWLTALAPVPEVVS